MRILLLASLVGIAGSQHYDHVNPNANPMLPDLSDRKPIRSTPDMMPEGLTMSVVTQVFSLITCLSYTCRCPPAIAECYKLGLASLISNLREPTRCRTSLNLEI